VLGDGVFLDEKERYIGSVRSAAACALRCDGPTVRRRGDCHQGDYIKSSAPHKCSCTTSPQDFLIAAPPHPILNFFTMLSPILLVLAALASSILGCPQHEFVKPASLQGRQNPTDPGANSTRNDWAYEASFNWGKINPAYGLCQNGTQQSPIALSLSNGLALNHVPVFNYNGSTVGNSDGLIAGNFYNWGYGPAFTLAHNGDWTSHPSFTYDNETVYLKGWHIHSPADHSVGGDRSKAELHLVHVDAEGHEAAVMAIRLDPGNFDSPFFLQLPKMIGFNSMGTIEPATLNLELALQAVQHFNEFWTYQGSLTSPPCHEGIRWFVARQILFTGVDQMQAILGASTYSARAEQEVWQHRINE
jgi:carbonic anhydrase